MEIPPTVSTATQFFVGGRGNFGLFAPFSLGVGPTTLTFVDDTDPESITSLQTLISNLENSFRKDSGGDCPEYCYDGIFEALTVSDYGVQLMTYGSQVVVVTDAPSKGLRSASDVINEANNVGVCIHFFLGQNTFNCFDTSPASLAEYERVANKTGGVVVSSKFDFTSFVQKYRSTPCGFLEAPARKRRTAARFCHEFSISSLVCMLSVTIKTSDDAATITKPNGERALAEARGEYEEKVAIYADNRPQAGQWRVCGESPIEISVEDQKCIDITPYFIKNEASKPLLTAKPPPGCKSVMTSTVFIR